MALTRRQLSCSNSDRCMRLLLPAPVAVPSLGARDMKETPNQVPSLGARDMKETPNQVPKHPLVKDSSSISVRRGVAVECTSIVDGEQRLKAKETPGIAAALDLQSTGNLRDAGQ